MYVNNALSLLVYQSDNSGVLTPIGELNEVRTASIVEGFLGYQTWEIWAPITDENLELLQIDNFIWAGGNSACRIEIIEADINEVDGSATIYAKGRTLEHLLESRVLTGTTTFKDLWASEILHRLVSNNCCQDNERKIPGLTTWFHDFIEDKYLFFGGKLDMQRTGFDIYENVKEIAESINCGFRINFIPSKNKLKFEAYTGTDKTLNNTYGNAPVFFSTDLEDILSTNFYHSNQDERNLAYVAGEIREDGTRAVINVGDASLSGWHRKELYVDARDLQSDINGVTLTSEEYEELLIQRGREKLSERYVTQSFDMRIRTDKNAQYVYGVDYVVGDIVTVLDLKLGVQADVKVETVQENYSNQYELIVTFGKPFPTLLEKVKQRIKL